MSDDDSHSDEIVYLHGDLDLMIIEARNLPNMDLVSDHVRRCFTAFDSCRKPCQKDDQKIGCKIGIENRKPADWLSGLLESKFFDSCVDHQDLRKNDKNVFCVHCGCCFCRHCISSSTHHLHTWVQICKYVYHDVVRLQDIQKLLDCSEIQTYKINGEKAIHLNPRPQLKDSNSKPPPAKTKCGASCVACGRYIQDQPNRFCSIACKVSVVSDKSEDRCNKTIRTCTNFPLKKESSPEGNVNSDESVVMLASSPEEAAQPFLTTLKPKRQLHKRKRTPMRAPFI